jgi:general secretion pathway protein M
MNLLQRRAVIAVAVTLGAALLLVLLAGQFVVRKHLWAAHAIEEIEPRFARQLGLRDSAAQLEEGLKQARAALARLGHPAERDPAQVGNDLQQVARKALQTAGMSVISSQVQAPRSEGGVDRISVALQSEGGLSAIQIALTALHAESPAIAVDSLALQATGRNADDGSPLLSCRITVSVLRLQS